MFIHEAQRSNGRYAFCSKLIMQGKELGDERVFTFAATATQIQPEHTSRVCAAATDQAALDKFKQFELDLLEDSSQAIRARDDYGTQTDVVPI